MKNTNTKHVVREEKKATNVEVQLTGEQLEIIAVFDRILDLSMNLFQLDDMKMQSIICEQFAQYQELIIRMKTDRFNPQIEAMIGMCIEKLKYPEWYQMNKKSSENEDEEKYLELRNDLIQFLEPFVKMEHFKIFIAQFIDQKVQESSSSQQIDIR